MNRILITTVAGLSLLFTPVSALADQHNKAVKAHDQQWHSHRTQHRADTRSDTQTREKKQRHAKRYKVYTTDHKAVKQRVAKHRLAHEYRYPKHLNNVRKRHYKHDRRWALNHGDNRRFVNRQDFYNYYSPEKLYFYDQHRGHYDKSQSRHARYSGARNHDHGSDYLEWATILVLLNDIYDDGNFYAHSHHN